MADHQNTRIKIYRFGLSFVVFQMTKGLHPRANFM